MQFNPKVQNLVEENRQFASFQQNNSVCKQNYRVFKKYQLCKKFIFRYLVAKSQILMKFCEITAYLGKTKKKKKKERKKCSF